jgi:dephospho-CoA kinase
MSSSKTPKIIGITGPFGSGKTTASTFFEKKGYKVIVLSSFLEEEAKKRKLMVTRKVLQDLGNEWRTLYGHGVLMENALRSAKKEQKLVIDGIRNLGEVEVLKKKKGVLLAIIADRKVRYRRLKKLKMREKLTPALFEKLDLRDIGVNEKITGLQTAFCIALADVFIDSNTGMETFKDRLEGFLKQYEEHSK